MQPNIIERVWRQDKMVNVDVLNGFVFTGEAGAHKFVISGKNVNTPVDISGTVTANFKNANNVLVPLIGTIEDGKAVVVLSQECYAVEGPFSVMIFADTVCIYAAIANVINSSGEVIAYPTAAIPDVHELIVEAQEIVHRLDNGYNSYPTLTVGPADVLTVTDGADDIPLKTLSVAIEPKQDLHGYDKPWVGGSGNNLCAGSVKSETAFGLTLALADDGTFKVTGTYDRTQATTFYDANKTFALQAGTYVLSGTPNNDLGAKLVVVNTGTNSNVVTTDTSFTLNESATVRVGMTVPASANGKSLPSAGVVFKPMIRTATVTDPTYEPYSNICPITGWDEATMTRTGKNLVSGRGHYIAVSSGVLEPNDQRDSVYAKVHKNESYVISGNTDSTGAVLAFYFNEPVVYSVSYDGSRTLSDQKTFTAPIDGWVVVRCGKTDTTVQIELSSTATSYEPYTVKTLSVNLSSVAGGTVYGGTVTVNDDGTGTLVVDRAKVTLTGNESLAYSTTTKSFYHDAADTVPGIAGNEYTVAFDGVCDRFAPYDGVTAWANLTNACVGYVNATSPRLRFSIPGETAVTDAVKAKLAGTEVAYKLATPQSYSLTATQLSTILGNNAVWCDAGQVSMTYRADTKMYIDRKIAELVASIVNS